ncbi:Predicted arabinose efflux permease, MFS family [Cohaesibacter sp. ES.047]|uniref:MFS transporter n=1 Tax=Cohaesibacter sp. ES.047 TaxID=1798205 RepID=UPI000BB84B67|nr:MFS transporter [Cohaesibacter sp. ES.047]SNY90055.1 Predicted arabinose efflux permease, MFS family [Cohaesibacter sp. ES.047]
MSDHTGNLALPTPPSASRWRTPRRAVSAQFAFNGMLIGIWASRIPAITEIHALDKAELGLLLLAMAIGAIASFPLAGRLSDIYGSALVTKCIAVVYTFSLMALALAPSIWALALALAFFGANHGAMDVSMNAWAGEVEKHLGKPVMSSIHAMWSIGAGFGAATGYLAVKLGADPAVHFVVGALVSFAITFPFATLPWQSQRRASQKGDPIFPLPKGALILVGLIALSSGIGEGAMADWSAIFLVSVTGVGEAKAALGYTIFSLAMVFMRLIADRIVVRTGPVRAARLSGLVAGLGTLTAIFAGSYYTALIGFALMGVGYAVVIPLAMSRATRDDRLPPGTAIASVATLGYAAILVGPVLIGFFAEFLSLQWAFLLLTSLTVVIISLASHLAPPK